MKKFSICIFFLLLLFSQITISQNIIVNNSFEDYNYLPNNYGELDAVSGWNNCFGSGTPDYFNTVGTALTYFGINTPHTGAGMVGICPWHTLQSNFREYISSTLTAPMIAGTSYSVSFWLASGINGGYGYGCNNVGICFSTYQLVQPANTTILVTPQAKITTVFYDTLWTQFNFVVTADSAFNYITIGNFDDDATTTAQEFSNPYAAVYYFIDDIIVEPATQPGFSAADTSVCQKFCTSFFDQSTNNPTSWQWSFPGGTPSSSTNQNPTNICYNNPGTYDVTLITTNSFGSDTLTLSNYITVYSTPPFPTITQNGNTLTCSPADAYQWQLNSVDIPGATQQSYTYTLTGLYTVLAFDSNGCSNYASIEITGVENVGRDFSTSVFPNPSNGNFTVELLNGSSLSIEVVNTLGQIVETKNILSHVTTFNLNVAVGVYFIEIKTVDKTVRKKIVITK